MSADNYILVEKCQEEYRVWNGCASIDEHPSEYTSPMFVSENVFEAVEVAYKECEEGVVEYGVSLSPAVRKDMESANDSMTQQQLMGHAWSKSDRAETSKDRDGWSFVAEHAAEIVAFVNKRGNGRRRET